jgi:hypothetical protein
VVQTLKASPSDSLQMAEDWVKIHREKILQHALKEVRARSSPNVWHCFEQRLLRDRPAREVAAELNVEPNVVYVYSSRVLKEIRELCAEFDEDISHVCRSDVS